MFLVTNFDPDDEAGQPNFDSIPKNAKDHAWWGTFEQMTVRLKTLQITLLRASEIKKHNIFIRS